MGIKKLHIHIGLVATSLFILCFNFTNIINAVGSAAGDANSDNKVDSADYTIWLNNFDKNTSNGNLNGDFNNDTKVDGIDYIIWLTHYNTNGTGEMQLPLCAHVNNQAFCFPALENPIQDAITYASTNHISLVTLDGGVFYQKKTITVSPPFPLPAGIYVPSNITLSGSQNLQTPTIIKISASLTPVDIGIYLAGSPTDATVPLKNTTLQFIEFDGQTGANKMANIGIMAGRADEGIKVDHTTVRNTKSSGIVLGFVAQYLHDPNGAANQAVILSFNGLNNSLNQVTNNTVENVGGDGLGVTGMNNLVSKNKITKALTENLSNCITSYISSSNMIISENTLSNCWTGIGIDGSYPLYFTSQQANEIGLVDEAGKGNEVGFASFITITKNTITDSTLGITLWRNKGSQIIDNTITSDKENSTGISVNESKDNYVVGNTIQNTTRGIVLRSIGISSVGSVFNGIGVYKVGDIFEIWGNKITSKDVGIIMEGEKEFLKSNTIRSNEINAPTPCDFSNGMDTIAVNNIPASCNQ